MAHSKPYRIQSITEVHRLLGLPRPQHPLIGVIDLKGLKEERDIRAVTFDFYVVLCKAVYERQFITRKITNSKIVTRLEELLTDYFNNEEQLARGLPSVQYIAEKLHISAKYMGSLLKQLTGQTTQQHIHEKLIAKAKEKLSTTELSISEIAYELGFEHSQSFSKLFKSKTSQSPQEFRAAFS